MAAQIKRKEEDILKMLTCKVHLGTRNQNFGMRRSIDRRSQDGTHIINLEHTYNKIKLAARMFVAVQNPGEVIVVSARPYGQRAVVKFSQYTGALSTSSSRWTPGTLTNQNTQRFLEPRLLIVTDPRSDRQAVVEASYVNIPCIALCDSDSPLQYVDCAIPCNNRTTESISLIYWLLAREILVLRGELGRDEEWSIMVDLFFYKKLEDVEKIEDRADEAEADFGEREDEKQQPKWDETKEGEKQEDW
eukprot:TRINITY_DN12_c0_g1_i1.p1 TRINITY_DN12_c0_g1~~TRINITY_DN12_c0_g1_i1.p1  ORF type:complete len:247 (+),score=67.24 TRINITY_DN12_c0_g1_i1:111-851(+)